MQKIFLAQSKLTTYIRGVFFYFKDNLKIYLTIQKGKIMQNGKFSPY